jgi:hypothetical protein
MYIKYLLLDLIVLDWFITFSETLVIPFLALQVHNIIMEHQLANPISNLATWYSSKTLLVMEFLMSESMLVMANLFIHQALVK